MMILLTAGGIGFLLWWGCRLIAKRRCADAEEMETFRRAFLKALEQESG